MTTPKERPILFSAPMVRAILDGSKTQTRRVVKPQMPPSCTIPSPWRDDFSIGGHDYRCPYGTSGDRLWVRETWQAIHVFVDPETGYGDEVQFANKIPTSDESGWWSVACAATDPAANDCLEDRGFPWRPPIFMPRWASRILLEITDVRVQRLRDITTDDCWAEGIPASPDVDPVHEFIDLWESINGAGSWDANPWLWAITFRRLQP